MKGFVIVSFILIASSYLTKSILSLFYGRVSVCPSLDWFRRIELKKALVASKLVFEKKLTLIFLKYKFKYEVIIKFQL